MQTNTITMCYKKTDTSL